MGADFVNSARGFMFSLGCIQAMQCNKDTCPTGVTTHNPKLQRGLNPEHKAVRVANYARNMVHAVGMIAHSCGVPEPRKLRRYLIGGPQFLLRVIRRGRQGPVRARGERD